jgi:hypothetical protein
VPRLDRRQVGSEEDQVTALGIGLLVFVHALDYATFLAMVVRKGIGAELNPIVVRIAEEYGLALLTVGKAAAVLLVVTTFLVVARSRPRLATGVLVVGILVGSLGALSNVASI